MTDAAAAATWNRDDGGSRRHRRAGLHSAEEVAKAYDDRDALRVLTLAQAAQYGPWRLSNQVRVEVTQQEARGVAMLGEPLSVVEQKA